MPPRQNAADSSSDDQEPSGPPGRDPRQLTGEGAPGCRGGFLRWLLLGTLLYLGLQFFLGGPEGFPLSYSDFREQVRSGNVTEVTIQGQQIQGTLAEPVTRTPQEGDTVQVTRFVTHVPSFGDDQVLDLLRENDVEIETRPEQGMGTWEMIIFGVLPIVFLVLLMFMFMGGMSQRARQMFSVGKSGAKRYEEEEDESTTFDDVAGAEGAKKELREVVSFLKEPDRFEQVGAEMPTGVLMVGPPGTGKTLLARAVAGEADVPFFIITGSDFMEMFVGVGAKRVRDLFEKAKDASPSIVFIDELDSIGRQRGAGLGGGHDEREQTLNQLLSELDGFEPNEGVVVMAATNRPDILDPALLRPGRFDRRVTVHMPSREERLEILRLHAKKKPLDPDVDLEDMAAGTPGFSGADLENLLNEAALYTARDDRDTITTDDLEKARDRILMGLERQGLALSDDEIELLAYHEGGHALVAAILPHTDPVHKVTVVPRGRSMGSTHQLPEEERYLYRKEYLLDRLAVTLGGRVAEDLVFQTATSGAEDDLKQASELARRMVLQWGMSDELGPFASGAREDQVFLGEEIARQRDHSEETAREVDLEVQRLLEEAYERATEVLEEHREALDRVAELLQEKEEITGDEVQELLSDDE